MEKEKLQKEEKAADVSPDDILHQTGGCGLFQIALTTLLHAMKCVVCWSMIGMTFITYVPSWRCAADDNLGGNLTLVDLMESEQYTDSGNKSQYAVSYNASEPFWNKRCKTLSGQKCTQFQYASGITTLSTEYDLICDLEWVKATLMSVQMAGMCVGNFVSGQIADLLGRKKPFFLSMVILFAVNLVGYFTTGWVMFAVVRLFIGIGCGFFLTLIYNMLSEYTLSKWRSAVVGVPTWPLEAGLLALACWLLHDWRGLILATSVMAAAFLLSWWFVPEGFRWLVAKERYTEAEAIVRNVSKWNKHPLSELHPVRNLITSEATSSPKKYTVIELFRRKELLKRTLPLVFGWMNLGLASYGIGFGIQKLSGSIYINLFLFNVAASPPQFLIMYLQNRMNLGLASYGIGFGIQKLSGSIYINLFLFNVASSPPKFLIIYLQNRFGRKMACCLAFACTLLGGLGVGIVQYVDTPHRDSLTNAFAIVAYIGISTAWTPVKTITLEVFPTVIRSASYGFLSLMARIGAVIGPQLVFFNELVPGLMYFIICVISFFGLLGITFLPETANKGLIDKMEDKLENREEQKAALV